MATQTVVPSRRAAAARQNGRLGGLATARSHTPEFLEQRSSKAGTANRQRYGSDYYRFLAKLRFSQPKKKKLPPPEEPIKQSITGKRIGLMLESVQRQLA